MHEKKEMWVRFLGPEVPLEEGNPLQYSYLENPMDRGAWWTACHRVAKSQTWVITQAQLSHIDTKLNRKNFFFFLKMGTQDLLSCSVVHSLLCLTLCNPTDYSLLVVLHQHMELAQTNVHGVSDAIQPSNPLSWANYRSFSFSISSSNEYSWLISFRIDWFDFGLDWFAVQGTLKSLSSPTQQLKSINSSVFSLLYGPTHIHTWLLEKR